MTPYLLVHPPGSRVKIAGDVPAMVSAVSLRGTTISYEVVWWDGKTRNSVWVEEHEVKAEDPRREPLRIGFHPEKSP